MEYKYGFFGELPKVGLTVHTKGNVNVPGPSAEETAIRQKQLELMEKESKWTELFTPAILESMGYKQTVSPEGTTSIAKLTEEERLAGMSESEKADYDL